MGTQKLSRTRRISTGILSIRQVSSTQLSAICTTDFSGYLEWKVLDPANDRTHTTQQIVAHYMYDKLQDQGYIFFSHI